jgi:hypothetical protein
MLVLYVDEVMKLGIMFHAIIGAFPLLFLGCYILGCALYGYATGQVGWIRSPTIVTRKENPVSFALIVIWIGLIGMGFLAFGMYCLKEP